MLPVRCLNIQHKDQWSNASKHETSKWNVKVKESADYILKAESHLATENQ